jgi:hypothetical protein
MVFVRNNVVGHNIITDLTSSGGISSSGSLPPGSIQTGKDFQSASTQDVEAALVNGSEYVSVRMETQDYMYGIELTNKLPIIDKNAQSIQIFFDASVFASADALTAKGEYALSLQIWNYAHNNGQGRWESIVLCPDPDSYEFWTWKQRFTGDNSEFRPGWGTTDVNNMQTVAFGDTFPHHMDSGYLKFNDTIKAGGNLLDNEYTDGTYQQNVMYAENEKFLFYDSDTYCSNKFQLQGITIDLTNPEDFETSEADFPSPINPALNSKNFYDYFVNGDGEFRVQLITRKKSLSSYTEEYFCVGDFKTYVYTDSNYLNYDNFDSVIYDCETNPQNISDRIDFGQSGSGKYGLKILGNSSFNLKQRERNYAIHDLYKFQVNFYIVDYSQTGSLQFMLNNDKHFTLVNNGSNPLFKRYYENENILSVYYNISDGTWSAYLNYQVGHSEREHPIWTAQDANPSGFAPRIRTNYSNTNDGICITSLDSYFYKRIINQQDFEDYKSIVSSYTENDVGVRQITYEDFLTSPENTFTSVSSNIDVIYSFHDEMEPENIFNNQLLSDVFSSQTDAFDDNGYAYREIGINSKSLAGQDNSYVNGISGSEYTPGYNPSTGALNEDDEGNDNKYGPVMSTGDFGYHDYTGDTPILYSE